MVVVDMILIVTGNMKDADGKPLTKKLKRIYII